MRAASATVRPKADVLPRSDAQRSHRLSLGSVWADFVTDNIPHKSSWVLRAASGKSEAAPHAVGTE